MAYFFTFLFLLGLLVLTQSRASLIAGGLSIAFVAAIFWKKARILEALGVAVVGGVIYWYGVAEVVEVLSQTGTLSSLESRSELWNSATFAIQDFPFTGIGAGTFDKVIPVLYPLFLYSPDSVPFHTHSLYLQVGVDFGIPGLVGFVTLVALCLILGCKAVFRFREEQNRLAEALAVGYSCGLVAFLVNGIFDSPLWLNKPHAVPFFFMAMLVALNASTGSNRIAQGTTRKKAFWNGVVIFVLWIFISLVAISFVGAHPYWTLGIAIVGGIYIGYEASRSHEMHEINAKSTK
ncbi:O-antigen ligase family protein [Acidobacteria bacterium AH-259-A15]|nr:O-antigen ligase family protein [Acidobacteria bacterium AH-259-A15]